MIKYFKEKFFGKSAKNSPVKQIIDQPYTTAQEATSALERASAHFEAQIADPTMDACTRETAIAMRDKILSTTTADGVVIKYKRYVDPATRQPVAIMYSTEEELLSWRIKYNLLEAQECAF